jgi:hypothetical protein
MTDETLYQQYQKLLEFHSADCCMEALIDLKSFVLQHGIPEDSHEYGSDSLRARIWKLFLGVPLQYDVDHYLELVEVRIDVF